MFTLTLVTPEKQLLNKAEIEDIIVPAFRGELNILPGHAPLMTTLQTGVMRYKIKGESESHIVAISWGYCNVHPGEVSILAETAERPEDINVERAVEARKKAEQQVMKSDLDPDELAKLSRKIDRALVREQVARHKSQ